MNIELQIGEKKIAMNVGERETLLQAMRRWEILTESPCGGKGTCGKCRVKILRNGRIPVRDVLACQITGMQLTQIWIRERFDTVLVSTNPAELQVGRKKEIVLPSDMVWDTDAGGDVTGSDGGQKPERLGVAFDIGTTTIAAILWDLSFDKNRQASAGERLEDEYRTDSGFPCSCGYQGKDRLRPLAAAAVTNPQSAFGADVISRIEYAAGDAVRTKEMQKLVVRAMNQLMTELLNRAEQSGKMSSDTSHFNIYRLSAVGNPTMMHFLFGKNAKGLAAAPFEGEELPLKAEAASLGLQVRNGVMLRTLPVIGGHLGADAASAALAVRLAEQKEASLVMDIGTNGELLLTDGQGNLWGCSTAAGPAFEGGNIGCGMRGERGAIERVELSGDGQGLEIGVIGVEKGAPMEPGQVEGICGSGLIDAAAVFLELGWMNEEGRLNSTKCEKRILRNNDIHELCVPLAPGVFLTQKDIRQLQMAKGAIAAGAEILCNCMRQKTVSDEKNADQSPLPLRRVYLAGAFGNYVRPESAVRIGLLPEGPQIEVCGNAAGTGASLILLSDEEWRKGCQWARRIHHVELADRLEFTEVFLKSMYFSRPK